MTDAYFQDVRRHLCVPLQKREDILAELQDHSWQHNRCRTLENKSPQEPKEIFGNASQLAQQYNRCYIPLFRFLSGNVWPFAFLIISFGIVRLGLLAIAHFAGASYNTFVRSMEVSGPIVVATICALALAYQLTWDRSVTFRKVHSSVIAAQISISIVFIVLHPFIVSENMDFIVSIQCGKVLLYSLAFPILVHFLQHVFYRSWWSTV